MKPRRAAVVLSLLLLAWGCSDSGTDRDKRPAAPAQPPAPLKITQFYASPAVVARGEPVMLCYGVENASAVRIEPAVEPLRPSYNRCLEVKPRNTVRYTLIAAGLDGREARQSLTVAVRQERAARAPEPLRIIEAFVASAGETTAGGPVTLCYELREARPVRLEPGIGALPAAARKCVNVTPARTTTYTLEVEGSEPGRAELTVRVR
jgi:hypothetical protein